MNLKRTLNQFIIKPKTHSLQFRKLTEIFKNSALGIKNDYRHFKLHFPF